MGDVRVREAVEGDRAFVARTWLRSTADGHGRVRAVDAVSVVAAVYEGRARIWILCLTEVPSYALGWAAVDGRGVRYVYLRDTYRDSGLDALLDGAGRS